MGTQRARSARANPRPPPAGGTSARARIRRSAGAAGLAALAGVGLWLAPLPAWADAPSGAAGGPGSPQSGQEPAGRVESVAVPIGGTGLSGGRSTVTVQAPLERVRAGVLGFGRYPEFMPHYEKCRVLGRTRGGGRDVYMQVSALHGAVTMWARLEINKSVSDSGVETYASRFLDGNVRDLRATWRLERIDAGHTRLSLEVFLHPNIPLPKSLINSENLDGSARGVAAMRTRVEGQVAER